MEEKEIITIQFIKKILKDKLSGKSAKEEDVEKSNNFLSSKINILDNIKSKDASPFQAKEITKINEQINDIKKYLYFLNKKDIEKYALPKEIHPAGMSIPGFTIEPIAPLNFVYNWCNFKGIANVQVYAQTGRYFLNIEGFEVLLEDKPITEFPFRLPNLELVSMWVKGDYTSKSSVEMYNLLKKYYRLFGELQMDCFYDLLSLYTFQSWLYEKFNNVFYLMIFGAFGAAKTTLAEMVTLVSRHGYSSSAPSIAFVARALDRHKIMLFVDELDSINPKESENDSEIYSIFRMGYRKGQKYSRINKETMDPESFSIYGPKIFTIHNDIEEALKQRSLPVMTTMSTNSQLPIINMIKNEYSQNIFDNMFIWYMENSVMVDLIDIIDYNINRIEIEDERARLFGLLTRSIETSQLAQLSQLKGRSVELGFITAKLGTLINEGSVDVINFADIIEKIFKTKAEIEEERTEINEFAVIRDILSTAYENFKHDKEYITEEGWFKIAQKWVLEMITKKLREKDNFNRIGSGPLQGALRDLGFQVPNTKRKLKCKAPTENYSERTALIYMPSVLRKLGLKEERLKIQEELNIEEVNI
jgi:hypothetical protein